jgi:succinate dehydrogenase/fumarate reductase cytochrome b subunit
LAVGIEETAAMKRKLSFIFLRITGFALLATFVLTAILQANNEAAKRAHYCYMPFFTELLLSFVALCIAVGTLTIFLNLNRKFRNNRIALLLSFVLLPAATSLLFLSVLIQAGQVASLFEILHMAATLIPVSVLIGWEYFQFKKWLANVAYQH